MRNPQSLPPTLPSAVIERLREDAFWAGNLAGAGVEGLTFNVPALEALRPHWQGMPIDVYLGEDDRYRRRRFAELAYDDRNGRVAVAPHRAYFQSSEYNPLQGGIQRWFEPSSPELLSHPVLIGTVAAWGRAFAVLRGHPQWRIELHQYRIEALEGRCGKPAPEGVHSDGVDFVVLVMIERANASGAETTLYDRDRRPLRSLTLDAPFDCLAMDDSRLLHYTSELSQADSALPAWRDIISIDFRRV